MNSLIIYGTALTKIKHNPKDFTESWAVGEHLKIDNTKFTRVFEIHDDVTIKSNPFLIDCPSIVVTKNQEKSIKNNKIFPKDDILTYLGRRYVCSTIAWMLALAMYEEFDIIHIHKVHMAHHEEYHRQRANLEWMIGLAEGLGIIVTVSEDSELLTAPYLYGYEQPPISEERLEIHELHPTQMIKAIQQKSHQLLNEFNYLKGKAEMMEEFTLDNCSSYRNIQEAMGRAIKQIDDLNKEIYYYRGMEAKAKDYRRILK